MAVDLGPQAAQAVLRPGCDICGEPFPYIPGGDEATGRPLARVGGPVEIFENLSPKVPGLSMRSRSPTFFVIMHSPGLEWRACTCGQRIWRSAMSLRSRGNLSVMAAQTRRVPAVAAAGAVQRVRHHVRRTWYIHKLVGVF
jgi:hypothetical protein